MTSLETNFLEVLKCQAVRFCSRAALLFPALLAHTGLSSMVLQRKHSQGCYRSYDNTCTLYVSTLSDIDIYGDAFFCIGKS